MVAFGSVILHKCALTDDSDDYVPIKSNASMSFPACRHTKTGKPLPPTVKTWASQPVVSDDSQLVISLDKLIGEGRIGMAYTARVEAATDASGADISSSLPSEVCIKVAKPTFARSLAREAWFYEQLGERQGTSTARCYGFFTTCLSECKDTQGNATTCNSAEPWLASKFPPSKVKMFDCMTSEDWLEDDVRMHEYTDEQGVKTDSVWSTWRPSADKTLLAIFVLEKLGEQYYGRYEEPAATRESLR